MRRAVASAACSFSSDGGSYELELRPNLLPAICCERPVDLKNPSIDFCPHCGSGLVDHCGACDARKSAFSKFCHACGTASGCPG